VIVVEGLCACLYVLGPSTHFSPLPSPLSHLPSLSRLYLTSGKYESFINMKELDRCYGDDSGSGSGFGTRSAACALA